MGATIAWMILIACCLMSMTGLAGESPPVRRAVIEARMTGAGDRLAGEVSLTITNDTGGMLQEIPVWLYPNRFLETNPNLNEGMLRWFYPKGVSKGGMEISSPRVDGVPLGEGHIDTKSLYVGERVFERAIAAVRLPAPLPPGQTVELTLGFSVRIPKQRGRFGRHRRVVSLAGGWFPRPLTDLTGRDPSLPPDVIEAAVRLRLPAGRGAVISDALFSPRTAPRVVETTVRSEAVALVVMERMVVSRRAFSWGEVIHVHQDPSWHPPTWEETLDDENGGVGRLPEPGRFNRSERLFEIVDNTAGLIRTLAPDCPLKDRIVLVDIPAWDRMVQTGPGPVLVSDRLWRLLPVEGAVFFHDLAVVRGVGAELVWPGPLRRQPPRYRYVAADMVGTFLKGRYSEEIHQKQRTVEDLVGIASIFPTIDNLLYAPMIPFREVYFPSVEEPDPFRDEPWYFMNELPRGKRILGKLEDLLGKTGRREVVAELLRGDATLRTVADRHLGDAGWFFEQWYGAYPKVNYRLGELSDIRLADGRYRHLVEVIREGAVIREPVPVRLEDEGGAEEELVWDSDRHKAVLEWISGAPLAHAEIDPAHRLVEAAELTGGHPFADNTNRLPWRPPMFTRLVLWGDLTTGDPYIQLGFWFRRKYDVTNVFSLDLDYTPSAYGGQLGFYRFFGKKRTLNARSWVFGPTISAIRYRAVDSETLEIPDESKAAATMGSVGISLARDTRVYGWDPLSGTAVGVGGSYAFGRSDDGRTLHVGRMGLQTGTLLSPGIRNTVAIYGGAFGVLGDPVAANLVSLSDRRLLRGFEIDETYGRLGLFAVVEYRHTLADAAHVKAPAYSWFDRFQGALFVAGGTASEPGSLDGLFTSQRLFTEVGYGLRVHLLLFGFQQYILALDFAYPLTPLTRQRIEIQSDGTQALVNRSPFKLLFGITQTF